jgi:hypothetical protein
MIKTVILKSGLELVGELTAINQPMGTERYKLDRPFTVELAHFPLQDEQGRLGVRTMPRFVPLLHTVMDYENHLDLSTADILAIRETDATHTAVYTKMTTGIELAPPGSSSLILGA